MRGRFAHGSAPVTRVDARWARSAAARAARTAEGGVKGDGGLVLVIGGSRTYAAPPFLAALAARRTGVHGVRIAAPPGAAARQAALEAYLIATTGPELGAAAVGLVAEVSARMGATLTASGAHGRVVWLVGPGLGGSPRAGEVLAALADVRDGDRSAALVVDGSLGGGESGLRRIRALGPDLVLLNRHEAQALLPASAPAPGRGQGLGPAALTALTRQTGAVVVAKGTTDLISDGVRTWDVPAGHPGLARHGTGDILAGAAAGLLAQALPAVDAAALACHLTGTAGTRLADRVGPGWLSRELIDEVGAALRDLLTQPEPAAS
ncbi:NAD(P)H-hydrate dehydratase [Streptomyces sp. MMBL 11-1]|uniref:NAD(P)H-hydrate dehydratase n=1 Tax=Streptomyces sp. MMBL 11-1 TaxID=3026420 RepID=UPI00235E6C8D|nr:NAD(P)H-hydrate dehydratase [Streptomyces sp. MMBL 11-1]